MQKVSINLKERKNGPMSLILCVCSVRHAEHYIKDLDSSTGKEEKIIINDPDSFQTTDDSMVLKRSYKQAIVSTGVTVPTEFWDNEKKKIITGYPKAKKLNTDLREFEDNVQRLFDSLVLAGKHVDPGMLKQYILKHIVNNRAQVKVFDFSNEENKHLFSEFIREEVKVERQEAIAKTKKIGPQALKHYSSFANMLDWYGKIYIEDIDRNKILNFFLWLNTESNYAKQNEGGYTMESINSFKKIFKKYLRIASDKKLTKMTNDDIRKAGLAKIKPSPKPIVYLSFIELDTLMKVKDFKSLHHDAETVRDLFVFAAHVGGKRFGDYLKFQIKKHPMNQGEYYVEDISKKTNIHTVLPAFKVAIKIWNKYNGKMPKAPNRFNKRLQEVVAAAGIDEWKVPQITSHIARKSFCTNMIHDKRFEINPFIVMMFSGHTSYAEFAKYVELEIIHAYDTLSERIRKAKM